MDRRSTRISARTPRPVAVPADLRKAFADAAQVKTTFERLPASHQRAYIAWIEEAKRPETRAKRIAHALMRLRRRYR